MMKSPAEFFIRESNRIEGIVREPTMAERNEYERFLELDIITVDELQAFVKVYQPNARLRDKRGLDVRVGRYYPPPGGASIRSELEDILKGPHHAFRTHQLYEKLHPFTDGNGRSGRMLWMWMMGGNAPLGFLHTWYYQSLSNWRGE